MIINTAFVVDLELLQLDIISKSSKVDPIKSILIISITKCLKIIVIVFSVQTGPWPLQWLYYKYNFIRPIYLMSSDISMVIPSQNELGAVYISAIQAARCPATLKEHRIGAIVSVTKQAKINRQNVSNIRYLHIAAEDKESFQISQYFQSTFKFIDRERRHTNVLVHCVAGVSRSATIVAAYVMKKYDLSAQKTISILQNRRKKISPNKGFRKQLEQMHISKRKTHNGNAPIKLSMTQSLPKQLIAKQVQFFVPHKTVISPSKQNSDDKKQKIVKKIQKIKLSLMSRLKDTQQVRKVKTVESQQVCFSNLLQSNIYTNKIKMKV